MLLFLADIGDGMVVEEMREGGVDDLVMVVENLRSEKCRKWIK